MSKETATSLRTDGVVTVWELYEGDAYEIAKEYKLSSTTVYRMMREYCKENGKVYENYLRYPHKPHIFVKGRFRIKRPTLKSTGPMKGRLKLKKIPRAFLIEDDFEYIGELIKSTKSSDVIEGIRLLEEQITNIIKI